MELLEGIAFAVGLLLVVGATYFMAVDTIRKASNHNKGPDRGSRGPELGFRRRG